MAFLQGASMYQSVPAELPQTWNLPPMSWPGVWKAMVEAAALLKVTTFVPSAEVTRRFWPATTRNSKYSPAADAMAGRVKVTLATAPVLVNNVPESVASTVYAVVLALSRRSRQSTRP